MRGRPAKVITAAEQRRVLRHLDLSPTAARDRVMFLLTITAGLRACEVCALTWPMLTRADGGIGAHIELPPVAAKRRSGRRIPLHPELRRALARLAPRVRMRQGPVIRSCRGGAMSPKSLVNWFTGLYRQLGLQGCSSHSGRRSFITRAARQLPRAGGSLRDVQLLAGHRSIQTTQGYIDGDEQAQRRLIKLI
ncbi:MAG TPA: site-specific integrase [Paracoccus sp. (in: a-proteobacteria)]|nr:site-specific integrase [Paracoccus sp. (in: a-proteobacteria)]HMR37338.1 site-specific integrase [Paracoccus sp. (in: a-proteobacteria)]